MMNRISGMKNSMVRSQGAGRDGERVHHHGSSAALSAKVLED